MTLMNEKKVMKKYSHKLITRKQKKHCVRFCSKLFKISTTPVTLQEKHVKHAPESKNLRGSGLPQLPLPKIRDIQIVDTYARIAPFNIFPLKIFKKRYSMLEGNV